MPPTRTNTWRPNALFDLATGEIGITSLRANHPGQLDHQPEGDEAKQRNKDNE